MLFCVLGVYAALAAGCATHVGKPPAPAPVALKAKFTVTKDVVFTPEGWPEVLKADLYTPVYPGLRPAVVLLHGGAWTLEDQRWEMTPIAERLARRGYVVLNATYRTAPEWQHPAQLHDVRTAIEWLRKHAAEHQVDPNRVAVYGYSAGAHLAALAGLMDGPEEVRVQAIVGGGTPSDLTIFPGGRLLSQLLGGSKEEVPERYVEASPLTYVSPDDPPVFLYHGSIDQVIWPEHTRRLDAALTKAGVRHEVYWLHWRDHITAFLFEGKSETRAIDFLDRELKPRKTDGMKE